jgi:hypothetical protein
MFKPGEEKQRFNIAVPRASYIAHAFTRFINKLDIGKGMDIDFFETSTIRTINRVAEGEYDLGIIRYQKIHEKYFFSLLVEKELKYEPVLEYTYYVLMSRQHDLAKRKEISYNSLNEYIEIAHGDLSLPLSISEANKDEKTERSRRIYVYERGSQFDLLRKVPTTYMWVSPMPQELLDCYGLVQKKCEAAGNKYADLLVYARDYKLTGLDKLFIAMTPPPLAAIPLLAPLLPSSEQWTTPLDARRARVFAKWLVSGEFASGVPNLRVFDLFDLLAAPEQSGMEANTLKPRYQGGKRGVLGLDSHPNAKAARDFAPLFVDFLHDSIRRFRARPRNNGS